MDHIGSERNISLIAEPPMYLKYKKEDFGVDSLKSVLYFKGKPNFDGLTQNIEGFSVNVINEDNVHQVILYDRQVCCGLDRTPLIEEMTKNKCNKSAVAVNGSNRVVGYCVICLAVNDDLRIEPLYADNQSIAELLIFKCCRLLSPSLDNLINRSWDSHQPSLQIANKLGLHYLKKAHLLFTKEIVFNQEDKIFSPNNSTFFPF